jgi:hypothetical protein
MGGLVIVLLMSYVLYKRLNQKSQPLPPHKDYSRYWLGENGALTIVETDGEKENR